MANNNSTPRLMITDDTRIWLFKTNPKYFTHIMKPIEGGSVQQFIQNNSHVCVHYKPGDIAMVWLTGDKGKGQLISAYYIIKTIETKTHIQDAVIEDFKEGEGHSYRLLDGSNRSEFIKTFEKRKQNSLQLISAATSQELPDSVIAQKAIIGQQVRLVWRRMNRLVFGEGLHFLSSPFHLDGYNHNAYRLYKEIRPEHRDYVVQMILAPPTLSYSSYPPPPVEQNHNHTTSPAMTEIPSPDPQQAQHSPHLSHSLPDINDIASTLTVSQETVNNVTADNQVPELSSPMPLSDSMDSLRGSNITTNTSLIKRKRQSSKEKVAQLTTELTMNSENDSLMHQDYYLKYNLLQIANINSNSNNGIPYIPPLSSPPSVDSSLNGMGIGSTMGSSTSDVDDTALSDDDEEEGTGKMKKLDNGLRKSKVSEVLDL